MGNVRSLLARKLWLILGWHFAGLKYVQHLVPGPGRRAVLAQIDGEVVQANVCLLNFGSVAADTVGLQDRKDVAMELNLICPNRLAGKAAANNNRE